MPSTQGSQRSRQVLDMSYAHSGCGACEQCDHFKQHAAVHLDRAKLCWTCRMTSLTVHHATTTTHMQQPVFSTQAQQRPARGSSAIARCCRTHRSSLSTIA